MQSFRFYYLCQVVNLISEFYFTLDLVSYIKELLLLQEEVILPGFGGFITKYQPAKIRKNAKVIDPPSREVFFDINKDKGNDILISHVARRQKISEEKARNVVSQYIDLLNKTIQEKGQVKLEGLGKISKSVAGSLVFEPVANENFLLDSFGLTSVEIPSVKKPDEANQVFNYTSINKPEPEVKIRPKTERPQKRRFFPVAAIIILLLLIGAGIFYFTGLYDKYAKTLFLKSTYLQKKEKKEEKIVFGKQVPLGEDSLMKSVDKQLNDKLSKQKALHYEESSLAKPAQETLVDVSVAEQSTVKPAFSEEGNFHIISGSFLIPGNADKQKAMLEKKGFSPKIIRKKNEFFYVSLSSYPSREQAINEMRKLRRELDFPLWILEN
jgi:nucleoid DNA-binding protein